MMKMIHIRATVKGEQDMRPFTRIFQYADQTDELIMRHSVEMVREKLQKNIRLNVNEALLLYAGIVADNIRAKKSAKDIEGNLRQALAANQVLIGVPETMRSIRFDALAVVVDGRRKWAVAVVLREPISPRYPSSLTSPISSSSSSSSYLMDTSWQQSDERGREKER